MKLRYAFVIIFLCSFLLLTYFMSNYNEFDVKETFSENSNNYIMKNIKDDNEKYKIDIYYPQTNYDTLNIKIKADIQNIVSDFKNSLSEDVSFDYLLEISFNYYEHENYISFVFNVFSETGGAHPSTSVFTVTYDIKNDKIIDITELTKIYSNTLEIFSTISYESLKDNEKILQYGDEDMLKKGLEKRIENFRNFAFDKNNLILFFNPYDVAPYVSGSFIVKIPYEKLEKI